ncbi:MAG: hypothetical protein M3137_11185 [Actinomycetota bacterium]|nr:hypothetical protein [Actinomycetota bacterium]
MGVAVASICLLAAACGRGTTTHPAITATTIPATTTTLASTTTTAPVTTTTTTASTTTAPSPGPQQVATEFVKAFYTWSHTEFSLPNSANALQQRCTPYTSPGLDALLQGDIAAPPTSADKIDWTPGTVSLNLSQPSGQPTESYTPYVYTVTITATSPSSSSPFTIGGQVALHKTTSGWKVTAVQATGATGPNSTGPASGPIVQAFDPAYGGNQLGV